MQMIDVLFVPQAKIINNYNSSLILDAIITDYLKSESFQSVIPEGLVLTNITDGNTSDSASTVMGYSVLVAFAAFIVITLL